MHPLEYLGRALSLAPVSVQQPLLQPVEHILPPELPGASPISLCPVSSPSDIFAISSAELTKQPVYIDDNFTLHLYGSFSRPFSPNASISLTIDCGSHCEEYGNPPGNTPGETLTGDFCGVSTIEQPLGHHVHNETCPPPMKGYALIGMEGYIMPMFLGTPGWYNFTLDAKTADGERIYCVTMEICLRWEDEKKNEGYPEGPWNHCRWPR